jgi:branched-chain amino acid transport system permease protein
MTVKDPTVSASGPGPQPGPAAPSPLGRLFRFRSRGAPPIYRQHSFLTWAIVFVAIGLVVPNLFHNLADQFQVNVWLDYALAGVGFYWVFGLAGRFAFCQTFMMALGGYMSSYLVAKFGSNWFLLAALAATAVCAVAAAIIGACLSRSKDFYFAIGTLAVTEVAAIIFTHTTSFSGANGSTVGVLPPEIFGYTFNSYTQTFWLLYTVLALAVLVGIVLERSPLRRDLVAARGNPDVAQAMGVSVRKVQLLMFVLGSALGGLSGSLLASSTGSVDITSFGTDLAIGLFLMLLIGGIDSIWGPIVGAAFYVAIPQILTSAAEYQSVIYGALLLVVIILFPAGLVGGLKSIYARLRGITPPPGGPSLADRAVKLIPTRSKRGVTDASS